MKNQKEYDYLYSFIMEKGFYTDAECCPQKMDPIQAKLIATALFEQFSSLIKEIESYTV